MTYPCQCRAWSSALWGRGGRISFVQSVEDRGRGRERHRRHRVNPFRGSSAGAAALAGDTAPTATGRLTMAGRVLPAISGPAERTTERTSRTGTALPSSWRALWRITVSTVGTLAERLSACWWRGERPRSEYGARFRKRWDSGARFGGRVRLRSDCFRQPAEWARWRQGRRSGGAGTVGDDSRKSDQPLASVCVHLRCLAFWSPGRAYTAGPGDSNCTRSTT